MHADNRQPARFSLFYIYAEAMTDKLFKTKPVSLRETKIEEVGQHHG
jgi:hypothetical protein